MTDNRKILQAHVNGIEYQRPITWCITHSSSGQGPGRLGDTCHYSALQQATLKKIPGPCEFSTGGPDRLWWVDV